MDETPVQTSVKWPNGDYDSLCAFYGKHIINSDTGQPTEAWEDDNLVSISFPYPMRLAWDLTTTVTRSRCHRLVKDSLSAVFQSIYKSYGDLRSIQKVGMDLFGGIYNFRPIRGAHTLSVHSWGAAIDLDPDHNPLAAAWNSNEMMPMDVIKIFEASGWTWGGRFSRPDCMHFEATSNQ
jgi:hypothetical protein